MSKIIGHTKSGKAIHSAAAIYRGNPGTYGDLMRVLPADLATYIAGRFPDYSADDHLDAAALHEAEAEAINPPPPRSDPRGLGTKQYRHQQAALGHRRAIDLVV